MRWNADGTTKQTTICIFWDTYQILANAMHWLSPYLAVVSELLIGLIIVIHSAIVLWMPRYYGYDEIAKVRAEEQIDGTILPFLM